MFGPKGIANWSVTHVYWSEHKWHPKSYGLKDISPQLMKNLSVFSLLKPTSFYFSTLLLLLSIVDIWLKHMNLDLYVSLMGRCVWIQVLTLIV